MIFTTQSQLQISILILLFELLRSQIEVLDIFIELKITKITIYTARGLSSRTRDLIAIEGADKVWPL